MSKKSNKHLSALKKKIKSFNFKHFMQKNKTNFINFYKYNIQFMSFVLLCLLSCALLRHFTIDKFFDLGGTFFDLSAILLLGSLAYLFKPRKQFTYFFTVMLVITLMNIINAVYYSFFSSFASFGLLASLGQTGEVTDAVFDKLRITHFIYLLMPIAFYIIHRLLTKGDYFNKVEKVEVRKKLFFEVIILGGICLSINISTLTGTDVSRFSKQWYREYIVERFGIIVYQVNDGAQSVISKLNTLFGYEEAAQRFTTYYKERDYSHSKNEYTGVFEDYNVIVMHLESIMTFLIDLEINGKEVTPNLNKLVKESLYFDNFYPQVSAGTSSDTEFTFSSSLMPVQSGTVFVSYYNRSYITLQTLLKEKGYYTFSMHGNKASMWNRNKMHPNLGYIDFYSQDYYTIDEEVGLGLSDHSFFKQSQSFIKDINTMVTEEKEFTNYMGTIITLSNHIPFMKDGVPFSDFDVTYHTGKKDELGNEIIYDYLEEKNLATMGNYIKSAHYADKCLGEYLDYVRSSKEYDKTLFVLYGDHAAQLSRSQFGSFVNYDFLTGEQKTEEDPTYVDYDYYTNELFKKTPLIIWSKDKKVHGKVSYPMGMIDCLPTLSNMLNIENKYALGHDIFDVKNNNTVVFANGNFLTNKVYYNNSKNESRILDGVETLDDNYIDDRKKYAEDILTISNDIIVYDLIEKEVYKDKENGGKKHE
ncbi:MAG: LTA synthase family protein [Bacilli bacterium]|jgi:lipoteichoic acid synthase|nr:LTA synthase family protein [Bacilli bacterium]